MSTETDMDRDIDVTRYMDAFLEETKEHLQTLTESLIELENADDASEQELLNRAFRAAHTIKGMSASMGFRNMEQMCHSLEDILDALRNGNGNVTPDVIDLLLRYTTKLEEAVTRIEDTGNDNGSAKREKRGYEIRVLLDRACEFRGVRGFLVLKNLEEIGEIIETVPSREDIEDGRFEYEFRVLLSTEDGEEAIKDALSAIAEIKNVEISKPNLNLEKEQGLKAGGDKDKNKDKNKNKNKNKESGMKSLRISTDKLDKVVNLVGELVINKSRLAQLGTVYKIEELDSTMAIVGRTISDLQYEVTQMRMIPVGYVFNRFPKLVRDLYRTLGKEIEFVVEGKEIELDKTILEEIVDPIVHLIRNAVDHGIESPEEREKKGKKKKGTIKLKATRETAHVIISVEDDGRGIDVAKLRAIAVAKGLITADEAARLSDEEALNLIFMPGFSTAKSTTEISGRGVGMDVVKAKVEMLNGSVEIKTMKNEGTRVLLKLPLTTAIIRALIVEVCGRKFAIPLSNVCEIVGITQAEMKSVTGKEVLILRDSVLPLFRLHSLFGQKMDGKRLVAVVVERAEGRIGLVVDAALGQQEIVVKPLGEHLQSVLGLGGFTITGDGSVIPILDISSLSLRSGVGQ